MSNLWSRRALLLSLFLLLSGYGYAVGGNPSDLPEPYRSAKKLPFNPQGWNYNEQQIQSLFATHDIQVMIKVGCWLGFGTRRIGSLLPSNGKLYVVNLWEKSLEYEGWTNVSTLYDQFLSNVIHEELTEVIVPMKMSSLEAAAEISSNGTVPDLIYIDGKRDTESVLADLNIWFPLVTGHGILCGNGWFLWPGVRAAVQTFANDQGLTIEASGNFWRLLE